jgi:hypothetical protein
MTLAQQLTKVYLHEATHHKTKLSEEEAGRYYGRVIGNVDVARHEGRIVGYVEYWRITFEQFGRLVCYAPFDIHTEDIQSGNVAFLADVWIAPSFRKGLVIRELRDKFFNRNIQCDYFCGEAQRKKVGLYKVFTKQDAYAKWAKEGVSYGA